MSNLVRVSLSLEHKLLDDLSSLVAGHGYENRSEYIRDLIRSQMTKQRWQSGGEVVGTLTLIYNHHQRGLTERLVEIQHDCQEQILASTHVHLSHQICAEMIMLRGQGAGIQKLANALQQLKGVYHAELAICSPGDEFLGA
ncbi:MAG: nickel-responsive transcriptional regulator NikR [Oligosphaeraceae bacterium]|nr:nickel-responsive transcriptional regulator NikR [Oligosphaeraceae bacterium]